MLALAPFCELPGNDRLTARLFVPPMATPSEVSKAVIGVTEAPGGSLGSVLLAGHRHSAHLGRLAADAHRRGWSAEAGKPWRIAGTSWRKARR